MSTVSRRFAGILAVLCLALMVAAAPTAARADARPRPTIVLIHGAFADQTSWDRVAERLRRAGYAVVTPGNPLRGPANDAAAVEKSLGSIHGPIVLVGHSYGGAVITQMHDPRVVKLVYIAAFAPAQGEPISLALNPLQFPGSQLLPPALQFKVVDDSTVPGGRGIDGYIAAGSFKQVFAQDVDNATIATMLAHQRSIAAATNIEPSGPPSWAAGPSWYLVSADDRVIPPSAERYMARRMHAHTSEIVSSHASLVAHPDAVTDFIESAVNQR